MQYKFCINPMMIFVEQGGSLRAYSLHYYFATRVSRNVLGDVIDLEINRNPCIVDFIMKRQLINIPLRTARLRVSALFFVLFLELSV